MITQDMNTLISDDHSTGRLNVVNLDETFGHVLPSRKSSPSLRLYSSTSTPECISNRRYSFRTADTAVEASEYVCMHFFHKLMWVGTILPP